MYIYKCVYSTEPISTLALCFPIVDKKYISQSQPFCLIVQGCALKFKACRHSLKFIYVINSPPKKKEPTKLCMFDAKLLFAWPL